MTGLRGMKNMTQRVVKAVVGRLIRKIHRQEVGEMEDRAPPIKGPMPLERATTAPLRCCQFGCEEVKG